MASIEFGTPVTVSFVNNGTSKDGRGWQLIKLKDFSWAKIWANKPVEVSSGDTITFVPTKCYPKVEEYNGKDGQKHSAPFVYFNADVTVVVGGSSESTSNNPFLAFVEAGEDEGALPF